MTCRFKASLAGEDEQNPKEATASTYGIASRMSFSQNNIDMNLPTIMQDGILYLSGLVPNWQKYRDIKISYQAVATIDQENVEQLASFKSETYITSETLMDAYNSTLIANTTDRDAIASPSYVEEGVSACRSWLKDGANMNAVPAFHEAVENLDTFRKKQFCITERGYLYLVPAVTQPTDVVAIIKGLDMPSLLRPIDTCHSYIGDCYVHGMMGLQATNLIDEFSIKVRDGKPMWRAEGDVRRNGLSLDVGEYKRVLETLGERWVDLI